MRHLRPGYCHQFGIGLIRKRKHAITGFEVLHVRADDAHHATDVAAKNCGKRERKILLSRTGTKLPVNRIHARAAVAINTVSPLTCGSGTLSSNFSFSGPPYSCSTMAFIAFLQFRPQTAWTLLLQYRPLACLVLP